MKNNKMYWDCKSNGFVSYKGDGDIVYPMYTVEQMRNLIISAHNQGGVLITGADGKPTIMVKAEESAKKRISVLKSYLTKTDYQAIKYAEGEMSEEDYLPVKSQRSEWRAEINKLQIKYNIGGDVV